MRLFGNLYAPALWCRDAEKHDDDRAVDAGAQRQAGGAGARYKTQQSYLAGEAIASYVEMNAWQVARIKTALAEARSGAPACRVKRSSAGSNPGTPDNER